MEPVEDKSQTNLAQAQAHAAEYQEIQKHDAKEELRGTASWFYWIAGLSVINTLIAIFNGEISFIFGLGVTQLVDGLILGAFGEYNAIGWIVNIFVTGIFVFFGYMYTKGHKWALVLGILFYAFDAILFVVVESWLSLAFHLFVLYRLYTGFAKLKEAERIMRDTNSQL
jgi:hypothetical protein